MPFTSGWPHMIGKNTNLGNGFANIPEPRLTPLQPALTLPPVVVFSGLIGESGALTRSYKHQDGKSLIARRSPWPSLRRLRGTKYVAASMVAQPPGLLLLVLNDGPLQLCVVNLVLIHLVRGVILWELGTTLPGSVMILRSNL